jgi:transposase InsO family protein
MDFFPKSADEKNTNIRDNITMYTQIILIVILMLTSRIKKGYGYFIHSHHAGDLFDNSIVAHRTGTTQTVNLVLNTIKDAKTKTVAAEVQLHSDQGFQYTSRAYFNLTKEYGITPSMSRRGNCLDNAAAENFFSILKAECLNRQKIKSFDEAKILIDDFIWFYNYHRIQLKTKLTPLEFRCQLA